MSKTFTRPSKLFTHVICIKKMVHAGIERERKEKKKSLQRDGPAKGPSTSEDIIRVAPQTTSEPGL